MVNNLNILFCLNFLEISSKQIPFEDMQIIKSIEKKINFTDLNQSEKNVLIKNRYYFFNNHKLIPRILYSMSTNKREELLEIDNFLKVKIIYFSV